MSDLEKLLEGLVLGDRLSLSKCITLVESEADAHQEDKYKLIEKAEEISNSRLTFRLAVTGVPGAGKSTLIDRLGMAWIKKGHKVAVLAIDPSSSISHGSILGDKTRMNDLIKEQNAFVRPSPTRLQLGGVAAHTIETIMLCESSGYDRIIIETVGVGQSETLASQLADAVLLLLVSGTGDELQGIKKGILESADLVFINKADGENKESASVYAQELAGISSLWPLRRNGQKAFVSAGSSLGNSGLDSLLEKIESFFHEVQENGTFAQNRNKQKIKWLEAMFRQRLNILINQKLGIQDLLKASENSYLKNNMLISIEVKQMMIQIEALLRN